MIDPSVPSIFPSQFLMLSLEISSDFRMILWPGPGGAGETPAMERIPGSDRDLDLKKSAF
jgi:hypothetical protein